MSIIDRVEDGAKKWILNIALKKGVVSLVNAIFAYCIAHGIKISVTIPGIGVLDTNSELALAAFINSALTVVKNWAKTKWPNKFGWM